MVNYIGLISSLKIKYLCLLITLDCSAREQINKRAEIHDQLKLHKEINTVSHSLHIPHLLNHLLAKTYL